VNNEKIDGNEEVNKPAKPGAKRTDTLVHRPHGLKRRTIVRAKKGFSVRRKERKRWRAEEGRS
jgi:hypothetical protein